MRFNSMRFRKNAVIYTVSILIFISLQQLSASAPEFTNYQENSLGVAYGITWSEGFFVQKDGEWEQRSQGLPKKVVYPFTGDEYRPITSLGVDPGNPVRVAITEPLGLFFSDTAGRAWKEIPLRHPVKNTNYLTAVALSPHNPETIALGTSFNGFFESTDGGQTWASVSKPINSIYRGAGFDEEISGLLYDPTDPGAIYFSLGFGHGLYRVSSDRKIWPEIDFPGKGEVITSLSAINREGEWYLQVHTRSSLWEKNLQFGTWRQTGPAHTPNTAELSPEKKARLEKAAGQNGIYVSAHKASGEALDNHLAFLKEQGFNSIVVDMKDDYGYITYDTQLQLPKTIGSVRARIDLDALLEKAHLQGVSVIARLVVFKDRALFRYQNGKYAAWDKEKNAPWGNFFKVEDKETGEISYEQREFWVDPFSEDVWDYNAAIAEELQQRGVDEIQFDYIRFPSDGDLSRSTYRFQKEGMSRIDALESFLRKSREKINIPISTDLYGFNSWYRMGNWIGQNIEMVSHYVDVISPMYYPSHFPRNFLAEIAYRPRARQIYLEGSNRSAQIVDGRSIIRPYIQAFLIGGELQMELPEYSDYLIQQIEGTLESSASGMTLWNASNRYYMVSSSLRNYFTEKDLTQDE